MFRLVLGIPCLQRSASMPRWRGAETFRKGDVVLRTRASLASLLVTAVLVSSIAFSQSQSITATIDTPKVGARSAQPLRLPGEHQSQNQWYESGARRDFVAHGPGQNQSDDSGR
jgi:hypothetical protein